MSCPLDYSLCNQTVTLYRRTNEGILRRVVKNAFLQWLEQEETDSCGKYSQQRFLLILPGMEQIVFPGDRVMAGIGPEEAAWKDLIPGKVSGLGEVNYVQPCFWQGMHCHTEAGRR